MWGFFKFCLFVGRSLFLLIEWDIEVFVGSVFLFVCYENCVMLWLGYDFFIWVCVGIFVSDMVLDSF